MHCQKCREMQSIAAKCRILRFLWIKEYAPGNKSFEVIPACEIRKRAPNVLTHFRCVIPMKQQHCGLRYALIFIKCWCKSDFSHLNSVKFSWCLMSHICQVDVLEEIILGHVVTKYIWWKAWFFVTQCQLFQFGSSEMMLKIVNAQNMRIPKRFQRQIFIFTQTTDKHMKFVLISVSVTECLTSSKKFPFIENNVVWCLIMNAES